MCCRREKYRFVCRGGDTYYWENVLHTDSRVEQITCDRKWFWGVK